MGVLHYYINIIVLVPVIHDFVLSNGYRSIPENTLCYMVFARLYMFLFLTHFRLILYSTAKVVKVYSTITEENCEIKWCKINIAGNQPLHIGAFNRQPNSGSEKIEELEKSINTIILLQLTVSIRILPRFLVLE
jgi:hypothetical protein